MISSKSRNFRSLSSSLSHSSTIHRTIGRAIASPPNPQFSYQQFSNDASGNNSLGTVVSVAAMATVVTSLLGTSFSSQTNCESPGGTKTDSEESNPTYPGEYLDAEPEIDLYDNLPEEDEPTHCSICLTYRQGPCRPYWRKVEACTKDNEKENKKKKSVGAAGENDKDNKGDGKTNDDVDDVDDSDSSPMSESTRCFKYMMPWIDCASKYRNLYTLIEMDTNYTEGIEELEATSRHFCWVPGQEPKIDWTNWQQSDDEEEEKDIKAATKSDAAGATDPDAPADLVSSGALWKTLDPASGDPKLITVETKVPPTINSGLGILECAYAIDQDNNVIGFAYGTKPSDLMGDDNAKADAGDDTKTAESNSDQEKKGVTDDIKVEDLNEDKMVTLNVRLVAAHTENFVLSASYTHRIEEAKKDQNPLESHLYKSKPFILADIPKLGKPPSAFQENSDTDEAGVSA